MRIVGGQLKGRKLSIPAKSWPTRPTTDYAREALFNILENLLDWSSIRFVDLFGGSGFITYEAVSRGVIDASIVESHGPCARFIQQAISELNISDYVNVIKSDVRSFIKNHIDLPYDVVFADPPYALSWMDALPVLILKSTILNEGGMLIIEHGEKTSFCNHPLFQQERSYGSVHFSFFEYSSRIN